MKYQVIVEDSFSGTHALRHYRGRNEPRHRHRFCVQVTVEGKRLQNKVKYLTDFVALRSALRAILKPMSRVNLNDYPPFTKENPSAENLARFIGQRLVQRWKERGVTVASVTVWESSRCAARFFP
jgi:6-pyruvoyltetrahydropterin/6-carboxytetrahydropterin synthase